MECVHGFGECVSVENDPGKPRLKRDILVADDDAIFREVASDLVMSWGYNCITAVDGSAALHILEQETPPTIAVIDWLMPGITGTEICRRMRAGRPGQYIYFILVSGRDGRQDSVEGLRSGADTYITKPLDADELRAKLEIAIRILTMEESLRDLNAETELFINSVPSILVGTDVEGRISRWNSGATEAFGLSRESVAGLTLDACGAWANESNLAQEVREVMSTGVVRYKTVPFTREGTPRLAGLTVHPVRSHVGATAGSVIVGADITEKRLQEDHLRQAQKLEAIGQLAAGIAHEINTPTQFVSDNIAFLKDSWSRVQEVLGFIRGLRHYGDPDAKGITEEDIGEFKKLEEKLDLDYLVREVPQAIDDAEAGLRRTSSIVRAMKEFSHPGPDQKAPADINAAIQTTITVSRSEWKYVAEVKTDLDPELPRVTCVIGQLNQVVLNIIVNAAHAIAEAAVGGAMGNIEIRTRRSGEGAEISISDSGKGIPEEIRARVFEPFFTTKDVGKGTGQGLALAHTAIVKEHQGRIWFESVVGSGTTFFLWLPL